MLLTATANVCNVTATTPFKYENVININVYIHKIHKTHTEHLFTRLSRTGSCTLEFLLQNDMKIILFTCSQKTIY